MSPLTKVFIAGLGGSFVATYAEPKITPHLPASLQTATMAKIVHASIAGASAAAVYYVLGEAKGD